MSSSRRPRILVAGLFHETNTFLDGATETADFTTLYEDEVLTVRGSGSPLAGILEAAEEFGWDVTPVADFRAMPGPTVSHSAVAQFLRHLQAVIDNCGAIDGILLVFHGAMVSNGERDIEGYVLESVRQMAGVDVPICGVLDLHANFTRRMADSQACLITYRENPHTDAWEAGFRAAALLKRILETGEHPRTVWEPTRILWPPSGTGTASNPMRALEDLAREIEAAADSGILAMNVFAGFAFADVYEAGLSFSAITAGDPTQAVKQLHRLHHVAWALRHEGTVAESKLSDIMPRIPLAPAGPVLLVEPADNIGAGASGRGLAILKALLDFDIDNSAVVIDGPEHVARIAAFVPGSHVNLNLTDPFDPEQLPITAELIAITNGRFTLEDMQSHLASIFGSAIDMGPCALIRCRGVYILLTSRRTPPFDLGQLRSQGIEPEKLRAVGIKAAVAHRRAWDPIASASFTVSTSGPCTSDLRRLPWRHIRRPIYPLDEFVHDMF